jgi:undecaprenyl pyrophosphate phosphatase UppP
MPKEDRYCAKVGDLLMTIVIVTIVAFRVYAQNANLTRDEIFSYQVCELILVLGGMLLMVGRVHQYLKKHTPPHDGPFDANRARVVGCWPSADSGLLVFKPPNKKR